MTPDEELHRLLQGDDDVPWARYMRGRGARAAEVPALVDFVEARLGLADAERELDAFVQRAGGRRTDVMDPWTAVPNAFRRVLGRPVQPKPDVYELPAEFFDPR